MSCYCTMEDVAGKSRVWTIGGVYTTATNPKLDTVNSWIEEVSSIADVAIASSGFQVPITAEALLPALKLKVSRSVADLCDAANSRGRLMSDRLVDSSPTTVIEKEMQKWVKDNAAGFENMGVPRNDVQLPGQFSVPLQRQPYD